MTLTYTINNKIKAWQYYKINKKISSKRVNKLRTCLNIKPQQKNRIKQKENCQRSRVLVRVSVSVRVRRSGAARRVRDRRFDDSADSEVWYFQSHLKTCFHESVSREIEQQRVFSIQSSQSAFGRVAEHISAHCYTQSDRDNSIHFIHVCDKNRNITLRTHTRTYTHIFVYIYIYIKKRLQRCVICNKCNL